MRRQVLLIAAFLVSLVCMAGVNDLLWDFSVAPPAENPSRGLSFSNTVNDAEGVKNGLKGIKLNSSGWCSFIKSPVAGQLRLTYGPRSGMNPASLQIFAYSEDNSRELMHVGNTCEVNTLRTECINLSARQNHIFITRLLNMETVLQRIEFIEGEFASPEPCEPLAIPVVLYSAAISTDSMSAETAFFIRALREANKTGNKVIYLPNGVYDLGQMALTAIEADHIAIIGESMDSTIIRNTPDYRFESIDKTATLRIAPGVKGTYLQNLTIQNALDYYKDDNGRAVALWDQGTETVCKNVKLLSYQDTYYSDRQGALKYFEDCEIHGTVDFICGNGNVYFKHCLLYCEKRSKDGSGTDALTASNAGKDDKGFVFDSCRVQSVCPVVSLGRSWNTCPRCVYMHTVLDYSKGSFVMENKDIQRWTKQGMTTLPAHFGEYHTTDTEGRVISPDTNTVVFHYEGETKPMNTILSSEEASYYRMEQVLGEWAQEAIQTINIFNH